MRVRCKMQSHEGIDYVDLTPGNTYRVIGIEADSFRIISDEGRPYLYPEPLFEIVDAAANPDWTTKIGDEGERYCYPPALSKPGFFEDYFEDDPSAIRAFRKYVSIMIRGGPSKP